MKRFSQMITLAADGIEEEVRARHVAVARSTLANALAAYQTPPTVMQIVDGRIGAELETVRVPGSIIFRLGALNQMKAVALEEAEKLSPVRSGRYKRNWFAMVDGKAHHDAPLGPTDVLTIVNIVPYARKIQTRGARRLNIPPGIIDRLANILKASYGRSFEIRPAFVDIPMAYVLQNDLLDKRGKPRKDSLAGSKIAYPAVIIRQKQVYG